MSSSLPSEIIHCGASVSSLQLTGKLRCPIWGSIRLTSLLEPHPLLLSKYNASCAWLSFPVSQLICSFVSDSLRPHGLQHARPPCPSPTPRACSNSSCPSSWWCHPNISSSVFPFSSYLQSFPASGSFPVSLFFALGGQSIRASTSASLFPMNIQDKFPLGLTGLISLRSKGLSRVLTFKSVVHF